MQPRVIELTSLISPLLVQLPPERKPSSEPVKEIEPKEKSSLNVSGEGKRGTYINYEEPIIFTEQQRRYLRSLLRRLNIENYEDYEVLVFFDENSGDTIFEIREKKSSRVIKRFRRNDFKDLDSPGLIVDKIA